MYRIIFCLLTASLLFSACLNETMEKETMNIPFFAEYTTPFQTPPFDQIREEHYLPAFKRGITEQQQEIEKIVNNQEPPTFESTVEALEFSGSLLRNVSNVFFNQNSAHTNEKIQEISKEAAPLLSKNNDVIMLNPELFKRVKAVYEQRETLNLSAEQAKLLDETYKEFIRAGANLSSAEQEKFRGINKELALLTLQFGENVLKETNKFKLVVDSESDLAGLPESVIAAASEAAQESGESGKWVFTIHNPSMIPFLTYSEKRDLREKIYKAYINKGDHNDELDNKKILSRIAVLRVERAKMLGYPKHADFILEENMAKNSGNVNSLLEKIWKPALSAAKKEALALQKMIHDEGGSFTLQPWDWWYYAEKLRKAQYDLDEEQLRPYFQLENVRSGAFNVANKLFGITFEERHDIPVYHEDVKVFEVKEKTGEHIGIFYVDYFPRASKRGGAWMNSYRKQSNSGGKNVHPVITNVCNFSKPAGNKPSLLSFEEVTTLFHEFGHALHGLLSDCTYNSLSGTSVPSDFVELPSQIIETGLPIRKS